MSSEPPICSTLPCLHDHDRLGQLQRLLLVVGHQQARHAQLAVQVVQPPPELLADARVQRAERLVQQQDLRAGRQRAGKRDPLALPTRKLVGVAVGERGQLDQLQQLVHPRALVGLRRVAHPEPERDVLPDGHVPEQRVVLEHEPEPPLLRRLVRVLLAVDPDAAAVGLFEPGDHPQHRALARAARPEQRRDVAVVRLEADVVHGGERAEALGQVLDDDAAAHVSSLSSRALKTSMPASSTIETSARISATM